MAAMNQSPSHQQRSVDEQFARMDPVKRALARTLHRAFGGVTHPQPDRGEVLGVVSVEGTASSALEIIIRVKTHTGGTRYFRARLSEML